MARANDVPARTTPVAPPTMKPCTKSVSITRRPNEPAPVNGPHEQRVVQLVEVPLVREEVVDGAKRSRSRSVMPRRRTYITYASAIAAIEMTPPTPSSAHSVPALGWTSA